MPHASLAMLLCTVPTYLLLTLFCGAVHSNTEYSKQLRSCGGRMHAHNKKINDWQESFRNYIFSKVQAAVRLVSDCYDKPITPDTVLEDLSIGQQDFSIVVNLLNYKLQVELSTSWEDQKARYKTVNDLVNDVLRQK